MIRTLIAMVFLYAGGLMAQHPKVMLSPEKVKEMRVAELIVVLDSSTGGYALPFAGCR